DDHIAKSALSAPPSEPDPADEPVADPEGFHGPTSIDLRERGIGSVIFSVGFDGDFSYLKVPTLDPTGRPLHTDGRSATDGVWFAGLVWMRLRRSGITPGASGDSAFFLDQIRASLAGARTAA